MKNKAQLIDATVSCNNWPRWCWRCGLVLPGMVLGFGLIALAPQARAVCEEGCDIPNNNTFQGGFTLVNNTTGVEDTAIGEGALQFNTTGSQNTAMGAFALFSNTTGNDNSATGANALDSDTTGSRNVAIGSNALSSNQTWGDNTATGVNALAANTADYNTATGYQALESNTTGSNNTAHGLNALNTNTTGSYNTTNGASALFSSTTGTQNTAAGYQALYSDTTGVNNTGNGASALHANVTRSSNIALGFLAGSNLTTGSNNIDIANNGVVGESKKIRIGTNGVQSNTYIAGIFRVTVPTGVAVLIDNTGHFGTTTSSARFKDDVKPMDKASEAILSLKPVTFRYKQELDPKGIPQFGLVAEDVVNVNPDLVARDDEGKPYTVRYEAVNAMLLNEFLKEHRRNDAQQKEIDALTALVKEQAAQIQRVTAQLATDKSTPRLVLNNP